MAALKDTDSQLADKNQFPLIGEAQTLLADLTIVFTTDDPGMSSATALTIADGDLFTPAEAIQFVTNVTARLNAIQDILEAHGLMKAS